MFNPISRRATLQILLPGAFLLARAAAAERRTKKLFATPAPGTLTPILGNLRGRRVMAIFFDYHCPYCRAMDPLLQTLVDRNPDLQVLFKEFPVLRWDSQSAARMALSAQLRGQYFPVHRRLMASSGDYTGAVATDIARWIDVDPTPFRRDMGDPRITSELQNNAAEAEFLGVHATPAIVTASGIQQGARTLDQLQTTVDALAT